MDSTQWKFEAANDDAGNFKCIVATQRSTGVKFEMYRDARREIHNIYGCTVVPMVRESTRETGWLILKNGTISNAMFYPYVRVRRWLRELALYAELDRFVKKYNASWGTSPHAADRSGAQQRYVTIRGDFAARKLRALLNRYGIEYRNAWYAPWNYEFYFETVTPISTKGT